MKMFISTILPSLISISISIFLFYKGWKYRKDFLVEKKKVKEEFERTKSILNFQREEIERALQLDRKKYKDIVTECDSVLNFFQMIQTNPKIHNTDVFCKNSSIIESYNSEKSITFFNSDIEKDWQNFLKSSNALLTYISLNTFPCRDLNFINCNEIPPEWDFKRFDSVRFEIINLATTAINAYTDFYDTGKRKLIV